MKQLYVEVTDIHGQNFEKKKVMTIHWDNDIDM